MANIRIAIGFVLAALVTACGSTPQASAPTTLPATPTITIVPPTSTLPAATLPAPSVPVPAATLPAPSPTPAPAPRALLLADDGTLRSWQPGSVRLVEVGQLPAGVAASLAPDGTAVAFVAGERLMLYELARASGRDITPPDLASLAGLGRLRWSPDSQHLLFELLPAGEEGMPQIYRAERGGGTARKLVVGLGAEWSPDGRQIAFAGPPFEPASPYGGGLGGQLALLAANGGTPQPVEPATLVFPGYQPVLWSADGRRLAAADAIIDPARAAVISRSLQPAGVALAAITWLAPDGTSVGVWRSMRARTPNQDDPYLFDEFDQFVLVDAAGNERVVASGQPETCPCQPLAARLWLAWAPDGGALLAGALAGSDQAQLRLMEDGTPRALSTGVQFAELPFGVSWSPDGRYALLPYYTAGHAETWLVTRASASLELLGAGVPLGWVQ